MSAQRRGNKQKRPPGAPPKGAKLINGQWVVGHANTAAAIPDPVKERVIAPEPEEDGPEYVVMVEMERSSVTLAAPMGEYETTYTCSGCGAQERRVGVSRIACFCCACNTQMNWKSLPYSEDED